MRYRLVYTRRAERDIQGLDPDIKERLGKALLRYEEDPLKHAEKLTQSVLGSYRFRIGDYRVVFDLEGNEIVVLRVGHRREIYKRG
ncbi:MAG TPA: type II toxin-antitoxin system RelE/ParE family toxin [Candidatus Methylomirabilis sp.]|nr:type II toxin-antitoxin system RelE/ParE family toxin [Candidatus Methylomirabilis sp.]